MTGSGPSPDARGPVLPLAVGAVARLLGMASSTLRTWDRRYGLGPSGRTGGTHRRYTAEDVARLTLMQQLVSRGSTPADAALAASRTPAEDLPAVRPNEFDGPSARLSLVGSAIGRDIEEPLDPQIEQAVSELARQMVAAALDSTRLSDRGRGPADSTGRGADTFDRASAHLRRIARAVVLLDAPAITALIQDSTSRQGVVATWESVILPVLTGIGRQWEEFGDGIEVEHVFSEAVLAVLQHRLVALGGEVGNPFPALLACGPEEQHSLPLHALAAALAERRVATRVLGARVPTQVLAAAVRRSGAPVAFVWSQSRATALLDVASLAAADARTRIVVGGPGWDLATLDPAVIHIETFGRAVEVVAALAG